MIWILLAGPVPRFRVPTLHRIIIVPVPSVPACSRPVLYPKSCLPFPCSQSQPGVPIIFWIPYLETSSPRSGPTCSTNLYPYLYPRHDLSRVHFSSAYIRSRFSAFVSCSSLSTYPWRWTRKPEIVPECSAYFDRYYWNHIWNQYLQSVPKALTSGGSYKSQWLGDCWKLESFPVQEIRL